MTKYRKWQSTENTKCGKYVYLEYDYDGEQPTEIERRKVYIKDGCEYYNQDLMNGIMEITASEFDWAIKNVV